MNKLLFERVTNWQDKTFGHATPMSKLAHLKKELFELEANLDAHNSPEFNDIEKTIISRETWEEYADCFLLLYGSAAKFGMSWDDINLAISRKMDKNEKRKWGKPDKDGVVEHIEEGNENE